MSAQTRCEPRQTMAGAGTILGVAQDPEQIDRALSDLADAISGALQEQGCVRRDLDTRRLVVLTHDVGNGVLVTAELRAPEAWSSPEWPVELVLDVGVGYEPALNLMTLLTMPVQVTLLPDYEPPATSTFTTSMSGVGEVKPVAHQIVAIISDHALGVAQRFADADAIERAIPQRQPDPSGHDGLPDPRVGPDFDYDGHTQLRLVLLAASGRHDDARTLLAAYSSSSADEPIDREDRRFIRQLTRWLDAGGPAAPPIAETLAELPREPAPPRWAGPRSSWTAARASGRARGDVIHAVRPRIDGKTVEEISALLAAECAQRDLALSFTQLAALADMMQFEQALKRTPFARLRFNATVIGVMTSHIGDVFRALRVDPATTPAWLEPPERAAYPLADEEDHYTVIMLDPDAHSWLIRAWPKPPRGVASTVFVDVWLTRDTDSGGLIAYVGDRRVGTIRPDQAAPYSEALHAAALFDEDPVTSGTLLKLRSSDALILEIQAPQPWIG